MKISIIGTGYVGLVTGTCFAERGNEVICVDIDADKVLRMQTGELPIYEPGLEDLFTNNITQGRLSFTTDLADGIKNAEVIFLALPTPPDEDGSADLSYILDACENIAPLLRKYVVIVGKSTVPVGTAEKVRKAIAGITSVKFDVVSNPEFLKEGYAIEDFMNPDRVVIGSDSERAIGIMSHLYKPFINDENPLIIMDISSAEMTKYAANAFLATKISFMNEVANICEKVGADVDSVRQGIGSDQRIGYKFLYPGIGFGGSCFPKDVTALQRIANENDYEMEILRAVSTVNLKQKARIVYKIVRYFEDISSKHFAVWGLSFKPNTDDIREAPALEIITELLDQGAEVSVYDPEAMSNAKKYFEDRSGITFAEDKYSILKVADALIIATEWNEFVDADIDTINTEMKVSVVFDGRNIFELEDAEKFMYYESVGRRVIKNG